MFLTLQCLSKSLSIRLFGPVARAELFARSEDARGGYVIGDASTLLAENLNHVHTDNVFTYDQEINPVLFMPVHALEPNGTGTTRLLSFT